MTARHRFIACAFALSVFATVPGCSTAVTLRSGIGGERGVESQRRAYARGYEVGLDKGRSDGRNGRRLDYERHKEFRDGTKGYNNRDGDRGDYRNAFRDGFAKGYREAYEANMRGRDRDDDRGRARRR
ncbi:MAG: hypothetical protein ABMA00_22595 [Gemmatimonas sp.]